MLQADAGRWASGSRISYSYQWRRCLADGTGCIDIPNATDVIYALPGGDVGHTIRVAVTARNKDGTAAASSAATAAVTALPPQAPRNTVLPAISGSAVPGQTLSVAAGAWTGTTPISFLYRWRRCDASGGGCRDTSVRAPSYTVSRLDTNHVFRVLVEARNAVGTAASLSDPSPAVPPARKPGNASPPTISGVAQVGQPLTGSRGTWSNNPSGYDYSWRRCDQQGGHCAGIAGAHGASYTLTSADVGHTIRFGVRAKNAAGTTTALSAPTAVVAGAKKPVPARPQNTASPRISGTPQQGQTLTADRGNWANNPGDYDYSWTRCDRFGNSCSDVAGAHGTTYTLTSADVGHTLRFKVTAKNGGGSATAYSAPTAVVTAAKPAPPANTSPPTVSGTPQEGKTLTGDRGQWSGNPTDYDYSWRRCNKNGGDCNGINGAHATTYSLTSPDVGHTLRFRVTAKNAGGSTTALSAPTAMIRPAPTAAPQPASPPTISGTPQQGNTLKGDRGRWTNNPTDFNYYWSRCDRNGGSCADISGAHAASYTLTATDVGNTIRFKVQARNAGGSTTASSVPTALILRAPPSPPTRADGCPPSGTSDQIAAIKPPARLLVDAFRSLPHVVGRRVVTLILQIHVTSTCGRAVQGALVYATATPYNQFTIAAEQPTGADGWATLVLRRLRGFPVSRHQQLITLFLRARKPGESLLGGISTRRLVSIPVTLR